MCWSDCRAPFLCIGLSVAVGRLKIDKSWKSFHFEESTKEGVDTFNISGFPSLSNSQAWEQQGVGTGQGAQIHVL